MSENNLYNALRALLEERGQQQPMNALSALYGTAQARTPTWRERGAGLLQDGIEALGADRYRARKIAETVMGGPSSNLPLGMGLVDPTVVGSVFGRQEAPNMGPGAPSGLVHAIVPPSFVRSKGAAASLPADELFSAAVKNTPGAGLADDGLLLRVQRNQRPEQGMMPSVRGGVFYLPEGAAQAKHYSTGKSGYGGSERIAGETLLQNPLFVKGATGGKAPESAFDQLRGKGAYQSMRDEALKAYGGYGAQSGDRVQLTREFLAKHAPELVDLAPTIVANSKQGNQLAYALQEAAVGSAVRNAGHDAVLGYSKQKTGAPFISEVFDVRERVYPDKFGGFKTWE